MSVSGDMYNIIRDFEVFSDKRIARYSTSEKTEIERLQEEFDDLCDKMILDKKNLSNRIEQLIGLNNEIVLYTSNSMYRTGFLDGLLLSYSHIDKSGNR